MGKKSREKKQRRELETASKTDKTADKAALGKVASGKAVDKSATKDHSKNHPPKPKKKLNLQLKIDKKRLFGAALAIIMLAILFAVGYLLFQKAFRAQPIAKFLPADNTVAVLEINSNFSHNQLIKSFKLLEPYPQYSKEELITKLGQYFAVSYENDLEPWLGRQLGTAVLNSSKNPEQVSLIHFAEVISGKNLTKFLTRQNASKNNYNDYTTYLLNVSARPHYLTIIDNYLFFSTDEQSIYNLIDFRKGNGKGNGNTLYSSDIYRRIDNNLPINRAAFFYLNFDNISDNLFTLLPALLPTLLPSGLNESELSSQTLLPFLKVFDAEGMILVATENNFAVQSFLSLDRKVLENIQDLGFQKKYNANLANYIAPDILVFWGAENLEAQLKRMLNILSGGDQTTMALFNSLIDNYTRKYFGPDLNFNDDILPLFAREFAFVVEKYSDTFAYKLLIQLDSAQSDAIKIHEIATGFASVGAIFKPKVVERTLEDGTVGKEIVAIPEEIEKNSINYLDTTVYELKIGQQGWSIYYTNFNDIAVITNNLESIKSTLDIDSDNADSLRNSDSFGVNIEPVLNSSDELAYFNLKSLIPLITSEQLPEFISIVGSLSSGRNYFTDGIVTINYLNIK